jgi:hypothetical protein
MPGKKAAIGVFVLVLILSVAAGEVGAESFENNKGIFLKLYQEPYQKAFHILIPKGWKAEGGMIPSGVEWNVVDLVENNIRFRVTSSDGKSFFGWYPRFYFQDPRVIMQSSGGVLQPQTGQVLNGCWLYPYLDVAQYVQYIVFRQLSVNELQNPRIIGNVVRAPELKPWAPKMATRCDYGYVNFECTINGTPMYGRLYSINYELRGVIWTTVGTFGWLAPKSRWKQDERVMELCLRSFRLNSLWVRKATEATRYRARKYHQVIQDMHRIDNEITQNRNQTRSDIQEEFYKVITDQIETYDPETGQMKYLPMYNHAYTDGHGNYFLRDTNDGTLPFENASEWHKLKIVNRNDPNYRQRD